MSSPPLDKRMLRLIHQHHIFTLATALYNQPWCTTCFYVFSEDLNMFIFTTDIQTRHGKELLENVKVAGCIALETRIIGKIRGIQFTGSAQLLQNKILTKAKSAYLFRFPVAVLMETKLWGITPDYLKMTDNRMGFGKKLIWISEPENSENQ